MLADVHVDALHPRGALCFGDVVWEIDLADLDGVFEVLAGRVEGQVDLPL